MKEESRRKKILIGHLEYCLEKLILKDNGNNTNEIVRLYTAVYQVIHEMEELDEWDAVSCYRKKITEEIKRDFMHYNIDVSK